MNGNIKKVDDAVNKFGKRREFMIIQNNVVAELEKQRMLLNCYMAIWRRASSEFDLNVRSLSTVLNCSISTARKALKKLEKMGLLETKLEKETDGGTNSVKTQDGRTVSNNRRIYIIHSALKGELQKQQMLKPGASITADFSADEINEAAQENVLEVKQEQQQIEPPQHEDTPPTPTPTPTQKPIYKNADIQAAIKRREQHIYNIGANEGVFGEPKKAILLKWVKRFGSEVKKPAADDDIKHMANLISGNSEYLLPYYIRRKALAEAAI